MHTSALLASCFAALAVAGPVHMHAKRHLELTTATATVTVWVTAGSSTSTSSTSTTSTSTSSTSTSTSSETTSSDSTSTTLVVITTTEEAPTSSPAAVVANFVETAPTSVAAEPTSAPPAAAPAAQPVAASSNTGNADIDNWTNLMNAARAKYHAPAITWDQSLADKAMASAQQCMIPMQHTNSAQNIYMNDGSQKMESPSASVIIDSWMSESVKFTANHCFGQASPSTQCWDYKEGNDEIELGHFTQMVWADATKFGCAVYNCGGAKSQYGSDGDVHLAYCNWDSGNLIGTFDKNVLAP